ncbi:MAG: ATP-binding cassette domain-containing protein [Anaerolineales bacterium]|uniref:ABC transporter ATP-binding protein n=1 Tax=Candidatus Villigracilis vicinus TaxID=3140679 RepID=UPI003134EB5E|nr:ATP-binding cassette domain-containing protein [Anaerolineales bacterium]
MNVELKNIHKHFGKTYANKGINLVIQSGTIQGILGENGAGKSTLMKVLSGFIQADSGGEIILDRKSVVIQSPADAIHVGVGMLHQDPLDFPPMRVLDNFLLGRSGGLFPNRASARQDFTDLATQFDFSLDPDNYVDALTVGERQQLEIIRLLWMGARVLILDEPTTGISASQKQKLFATLKKLAEQGMTIIFVSHKLEDVEFLCNQVAVLRAGELVGEMKPPFDTAKLVEMMFGKVVTLGERQPAKTGDTVLSLQDISLEDVRLKIKNVSLDLRAGEVVGLAGLEGSGQGMFIRACAGLVRPVGGKVLLKGKDLTGKPYHAFKHDGVNFLPAARLEEGLVPGLSLTDHFVLAEEPKGVFIDRAAGQKLAEDRIKSFNIRGTPTSTVESLSGGNQQRAELALLQTPLSLVLLEHPTRGLDIESVIYIWSKLKDRCKQDGAAIIFISSDLEEVLQYSDRLLVFFSGKVSEPIDAATTTVEQLGQLIGGKGWPQKGGSNA